MRLVSAVTSTRSPLRGPGPDLAEQVLDLAGHRADLDHRLHQARRPDDLLGDAPRRLLQLVGRRRRRDVDALPDPLLELLEAQRPVVVGRGEAEAVLDEVRLARAVAVRHGPQLRQRGVALVDHEQEILREVVEQRRRRRSRRAAREVPRVVLDPGAEADLADHLQVEARALLQALGLEQLLLAAQPGQPLAPARPRSRRASGRPPPWGRRSGCRARSSRRPSRRRPRRSAGRCARCARPGRRRTRRAAPRRPRRPGRSRRRRRGRGRSRGGSPGRCAGTGCRPARAAAAAGRAPPRPRAARAAARSTPARRGRRCTRRWPR